MTERHEVTIAPDMLWGAPCVDRKRTTAEMVARVWWSGSLQLHEITEDWPDLTRGAILVACWYMARYGAPIWRKRWRDWLVATEAKLWHGDYEGCPMPAREIAKEVSGDNAMSAAEQD